MEQSTPLILASGSPRRQSLLKELGLQFSVVLKDVDEQYPDNLRREEVAIYLARKKAAAYETEVAQGNTIITADTIVCVDDHILNKASGYEEAFQMLRMLSGRTHQVITAVCVSQREFSKCFHVITNVVFKRLSDEEISYYIENFQPFDKAGAYGIQEWIGLIGMERMEGSFYNVVGLPVKELYEQLLEVKFIKGL